MIKNIEKKQKFKINQEFNGSGTFEENEAKNVPMKSETSWFDLKDFPQLKTSTRIKNDIHEKTHFGGTGRQSNKSFLSVVSSEEMKNLNETFPALHDLKWKKKSVNIKIDKIQEESQQGTSAKETSVEKEFEKDEKKKDKTEEGKCNSKIINQPPRNPHKKKRSEPVVCSLENILAVQRFLKNNRKRNTFKRKFERGGSKEAIFGNLLDSSNPKRSRGKHREVKKKKPTKLKLAIIKERIIKRKLKEKSVDEDECFHLIEALDFKSEIRNYLKELEKDRNSKSESVSGGNERNVSEKCPRVGKDRIDGKEKKRESEIKGKNMEVIKSGKEMKFTSKFREYCDNTLSQSLNSSVEELIRGLVKLQDRVHSRDPMRAKARRRHVSGLREVRKYLALRKVKLIVIAPNLEKLEMEGGLYDVINDMKAAAEEQGVPCAFALDRFSLGRCTRKNVPVSAFAVLNYEGVEELFEKTLHHLKEAKENFLELTKEKKKREEKENEEDEEDVNCRVISSLISILKNELCLSESKEKIQAESE